MTDHTDRFARHVTQRDAERAARVKVTWRKVSDLTGGGWSGLGPKGALVYVKVSAQQGYEYGHRRGALLLRIGYRTTLRAAKEAAAELFLQEGGS